MMHTDLNFGYPSDHDKFWQIWCISEMLQLIQAVQPDVVMVELCKGRLSILQLDEETLLEEAKDLNMEKLRISIKQVKTVGRSKG